uniref:Chemotaxis protein n=1 Tax=Enterovibrio norvegicus TaxID=188144 RepID=A0A0H4A3W2_9GAMM|nr:hypothetical protein [Enterovibrio norvegicus]
MKSLRLFKLGIICSSLSFNAVAVMGVGDIVSDPVSYSYYAQEIEQAGQILKTAQEELKYALETKDLTLKTVKNLEGTLRRAQNTVKSIERFKDQLKRDPWTYAEEYIKDPDELDRDLTRLYSKADRTLNPTRDSYDQWLEQLGEEDAEGIPNLPAKPEWISSKQAKDRQAHRDISNALKKSVKADALISVQLDDLQYLSDLTNGAMSQKDATDVGNAIGLKMIENQTQIITLLSSINRSMVNLASREIKTNDGKALSELQSLTSDKFNKTALDGNSDSESKSVKETLTLFGGKKLF